MCVQSGRVYAALPPNVSVITPTYSLGQYENFFANLTDAVLKRGVKYPRSPQYQRLVCSWLFLDKLGTSTR
ncbi:hypothetical_protein (plasmid) [Leishmania braziliensis MHOM/BR/75/M2904]|uniref:Hypothetical_protein n=1 Tax=Leishmania braziliensis MHOM/BR/75/M2904 TaxID=420245 RepID=A0A3P3Z7U8_LEIBR|nr:hypothetical_protein [Leishmania braziliensis MHOM/BR/75/M2904]